MIVSELFPASMQIYTWQFGTSVEYHLNPFEAPYHYSSTSPPVRGLEGQTSIPPGVTEEGTFVPTESTTPQESAPYTEHKWKEWYINDTIHNDVMMYHSFHLTYSIAPPGGLHISSTIFVDSDSIYCTLAIAVQTVYGAASRVWCFLSLPLQPQVCPH